MEGRLKRLVMVLAVPLLGLSACGQTTGDRAISGAGIGAGAGLVGGALMGSPLTGALRQSGRVCVSAASSASQARAMEAIDSPASNACRSRSLPNKRSIAGRSATNS